MKNLSHLVPNVRITITDPRSESSSAFGLGIAALCDGVKETGSLNAAAKSMGMAYSKAWRIIKDTEAALGVQLLIRDGAHGSTLTPEGIALLEIYYALSKSLQDQATKTFEDLL